MDRTIPSLMIVLAFEEDRDGSHFAMPLANPTVKSLMRR
jgi:hypothetical protein